jgi:hypothetical protein
MRFCDAAGAVGKGLVAGAIGTAAMTVSSTVEMKRRGRKPSDVPARAAGKVLGVEPVGEVAIDAWHHLVYAVATRLVYAVLDRAGPSPAVAAR